MSIQNLIFETFPVGPLKCNCTIIGDPKTRKSIVIDPGGDADKIINRVLELDLHIEYILHTHAHLDHFLASAKIKDLTGANLALHKEDLFLWDSLEEQCRMFGIPYEKTPPPDKYIEHEEEIFLDSVCGKALHTPGHTPGSMCFLFDNYKLLIAGDTLFQGSIGRTDLWGGNFQKIEKSIKEQLYTLDEEVLVITGHGESTSIGKEIRTNSYVRA